MSKGNCLIDLLTYWLIGWRELGHAVNPRASVVGHRRLACVNGGLDANGSLRQNHRLAIRASVAGASVPASSSAVQRNVSKPTRNVIFLCSIFLIATSVFCHATSIILLIPELTDAQAQEIGKRIWKNECGGTVEGLTSWNKGEEFPSLGIGHFIWYPKDKRGPFEESFPGLIRYLKSEGIRVPAWMEGPCPWNTREEFLADLQKPRLVELRKLLSDTVPQQARFAAARFAQSMPKVSAAASPGKYNTVRKNFNRVACEPLGPYALMDYVNFKGEGTNPKERYNGQGWGLLQVLETMSDKGDPLEAFAKAADTVLTRRVKNSPPARNEARWLPGWRNRLATYLGD